MQKLTIRERGEERYWSRFADSYDRDGAYVAGRPILQAIEDRLSEERDLGECVEIGCGTGYFSQIVAANAQQLTATDLSDEMLEVARARLECVQNVAIQKADCVCTGFPAESCDSVLMANVVHVVDAPVRCLKESHRILRRGGRLIVVDLTSYRLDLLRSAQLGLRYLMRWGKPPRHGQSYLAPEELVRLVESAGFQVAHVQLLQGDSNAIYLSGIKCIRSQVGLHQRP